MKAKEQYPLQQCLIGHIYIAFVNPMDINKTVYKRDTSSLNVYLGVNVKLF